MAQKIRSRKFVPVHYFVQLMTPFRRSFSPFKSGKFTTQVSLIGGESSYSLLKNNFIRLSEYKINDASPSSSTHPPLPPLPALRKRRELKLTDTCLEAETISALPWRLIFRASFILKHTKDRSLPLISRQSETFKYRIQRRWVQEANQPHLLRFIQIMHHP
jgi:hypothetical protein